MTFDGEELIYGFPNIKDKGAWGIQDILSGGEG